jgi:DNA primase
MEERVLIGEMNKVLRKASKTRAAAPEYLEPPEIVAPSQEKSDSPASGFDINYLIAFQERESIRLLLKYGFNELEEGKHLHQYLFDELEEIVFNDPVHAQILEEFKLLLSSDKVADAQHFIDNGSPEVRKVVIDLVHERHQVSKLWQDKFKIRIPSESDSVKLEHVAYTNVLRLKQRVVRKLIEGNLEKLKEAQTNEEQTEIQQIHHELKLTEKEIADRLGNVILK